MRRNVAKKVFLGYENAQKIAKNDQKSAFGPFY